jgi:sugar phosphate isomerase/epimerase
MRLGYNTNGFAHHRLEDAVEIIAEAGYRALALTPDVHHLPPFESSTGAITELRRRLERLDLALVVETGARFVLDARRKHRPTLLEGERAGREARLRLLTRCAEIAAELGGETISIWSGVLPQGMGREEAWEHLVSGVAELCRSAERLGVRVAFEPEPGMLVETLEGWERLREEVAHPALGLTLDVGHVPCTESIGADDAIRRHGGELINVHLDDVRGRVHDHLQIGEGELDFGAVLRALEQVGYAGVASVELSRHSHAAPEAARVAWERLTGAGRPGSR